MKENYRNNRLGISSCLISILVCAVITTACTNNAYEEGDGELSHTTAEFVDVTVLKGTVAGIVNDEGKALTIKSGQTFGSVKTDTLMRCLLYYNKVEGQPVELLSYKPVYVLATAKPTYKPTYDPVTLTSIWKANSGRYINMQVGLKTGKIETKKHELALVQDSVRTYGKGHIFYSLSHNQNDIQQYYTESVYLSIPWAEQDSVSVTVTTSEGAKMYTFTR